MEKLEDESLRYGSAQRGEAIRGELQMYAAILNQTVNAAEKMTKLGLAERRIELDQRIGAALIWVVANSLKDLGVDADQPQVTSVVQARLVEAGDRDEQSHAIAARKGA